MASFFKNTFDNLVQNINQTLNPSPLGRNQPPNSTRQRSSNANSRSRPSQRDHPQQQQQQTRQTSHNNAQHSPRVFVRTNPPNDPTSNHYRSTSQQHHHHHQPQQQHSNSGRPYYPQQQQQQPQPPQQQQRGDNAAPPNLISMANNKLDICDIRDVNDISSLSAKELKIILTRNCVDYKGVFEKEVLREKVMQLWIDCNEKKERRRAAAAHNQDKTQGSRDADDSDDIDENQACKICMEREINCVLLECGHMLTCVTCGRKLAECPICRQNVTRCVRTFRG